MAVVVVGGQSRNIGKTSVVAGLIARLPEFRWTALKITQYGHGLCTADGKPCACQPADSCVGFTVEHDPDRGTDTSRFLAAGAVRSIWVRTRIGTLVEAMPRIQEELTTVENAILESNSVLEFLRPDLYLTVLDPAVDDFKDSARRFLGQADAAVISSSTQARSRATLVINGKPRFEVHPPTFVSDDLAAFVRTRLGAKTPLTATGSLTNRA